MASSSWLQLDKLAQAGEHRMASIARRHDATLCYVLGNILSV